MSLPPELDTRRLELEATVCDALIAVCEAYRPDVKVDLAELHDWVHRIVFDGTREQLVELLRMFQITELTLQYYAPPSEDQSTGHV